MYTVFVCDVVQMVLCMFIGPSEEIPGVPDDVDEEDESKFVSCPHNVCTLV